jgi:hypothetical protein
MRSSGGRVSLTVTDGASIVLVLRTVTVNSIGCPKAGTGLSTLLRTSGSGSAGYDPSC